MSDALARLFDRVASAYDAERHMLVPGLNAFYGAAVEALGPGPLSGEAVDLGAGTGLISALAAARHSGLGWTLVDASAAMLGQAEARFAEAGLSPPRVVEGTLPKAMPAGPFTAALSALALHHLEEPACRELLRRLHAALLPGAPFVNAEQIGGASPAKDTALDTDWEREVRSLGATDAMIAAARERMTHDRCVPAERFAGWLTDAGFSDVHVPWAEGRFAVISARA